MSRTFDGTNTFHLDAAVATISAPPITMFAWAKLAALGAARQMLNVGTSASASNRMALSVVAANNGRFSDQDGSARDAISTTPTIADTTNWHLITGGAVDHTVTGRFGMVDAYYPGKGSGTGGTSAPSAPNCMRISGSPDGANNMNGLLAHVGFYSVVLTDAEIEILRRFGPLAVQRANLVEYWPLTGNNSPEPSYGSSATSMTLTGAVVYSTDNPIFPGAGAGRIGSFIGAMP